MTICIAKIFRYNGAEVVICCADSHYLGYKDFHLKFDYVKGDAVLASGTVAAATEMIAFLQDHLDLSGLTGFAVVAALQRAMKGYKEFVADRYLGLKWNTSWEEYKSTGCEYLPQEHQNAIANYLSSEDFNLGCELLMIHFEGERARLFRLGLDGVVAEETKSRVAVTGSGSTLAIAKLYSRHLEEEEDLFTALYTVYEAKKFSEADKSVGPDTYMAIIDPDDILWVNESGFDFLQEEYDANHPPIVSLALPPNFFVWENDYSGLIEAPNFLRSSGDSDTKADDPGVTSSKGPKNSEDLKTKP